MTSAVKRKSAEIRILLVDDHPIVRRGLAQFLQQTPDIRVCGEADDASKTLEAIKQTSPDLVIVDLSLEGVSGLDLIEEINSLHPKLPMLVLSMHDETLYAERALRAGARGYVMKDKPVDEVLTAIRSILTGEVYLSSVMSARLVRKMVGGSPEATDSLVGRLSNRELQVFELIGHGYGTRNIAAKLHLSVKTIDTHRENIKRKLNLADTVELHQHAFLWAQRLPESGSSAEPRRFP
jgi:DNA-binding NarL/FixJ family response regulator